MNAAFLCKFNPAVLTCFSTALLLFWTLESDSQSLGCRWVSRVWRMSVWDIWCSGSGLDSALQGSSVSRSMSWHEFEGSGCVCVWGPPDVQTERRALFSQPNPLLSISLSTSEDQRSFEGLRRNATLWRLKHVGQVQCFFKCKNILWKYTSVYPYKKKGATVLKEKTWSCHDTLYFSLRCL